MEVTSLSENQWVRALGGHDSVMSMSHLPFVALHSAAVSHILGSIEFSEY